MERCGITSKYKAGPWVQLANSERKRLTECAEVKIKFKSKQVTVPVWVFAEAPYDLILGNNWLRNAMICIKFTPWSESITTSWDNALVAEVLPFDAVEPSASVEVVIERDTQVPGRTTQTVQLRSKQNLEGAAIIEPKFKHPWLMPAAIVNFQNGKTRTAITNLAFKQETLKENEVVGEVLNEAEADDSHRGMNRANLGIHETLIVEEATKINPDLPQDKIEDIVKVIKEFPKLFEEVREYGQIKNLEFKIDLIEGAKPFSSAPYEKSPADRRLIAQQIEEMLELKVIRRAESTPFASPVFTVKKRDGGSRFVIDYRKLNAITKDERWPLPNIQSILDVLKGANWFSTLDLKSGYWQCRLAEEDKYKAAFITHLGTFEFNVLPFGLKNAPAFFQRMIDLILLGLKWECCLCYLDDVIIFAKNWESHINNLKKVLKAMNNANLRLNLKKSEFAFNTVNFLGHSISHGGVKPDQRNIKPISEFATPKDVKGVMSFVGLVNFYRQFIPNFAAVAAPLYALTKKDAEFIWTQECQEAFVKLKQAVTTVPVLAFFDESKEIRVYTDACRHGIGAIMHQVHPEGERIVMCVSRSTTKAEKNYHITELEGLAIVWGLEMMRNYLMGRHFTLVSDNHACCHIVRAKGLSPKSNLKTNSRITRWLLKLNDYQFDVIHRKGADHGNVDCISRFPLDIDYEEQPEDLPLLLADESDEGGKIDTTSIRKEQEKDDFCIQLKGDADKRSRAEVIVRGGILFQRTEKGPKPLVPKNLRSTLLREMHDDPYSGGHLGRDRTLRKIQERFTWPGLHEDVRQFVASCHVCQMTKRRTQKTKGLLKPVVTCFPFQLVGTDAIGPLPRTSRGNQFILTMIDYFSKWAEAKAVQSLTAEATLRFYKNVFARHGCPKQLLCDNGSNFVAYEVQNFLKNKGIRLIRSTPYNPMSNGEVERFNQTIQNILKRLVLDHATKWDELLDEAVWTYNTARQETTKVSPFVLIYGRTPLLPVDIRMGSNTSILTAQERSAIDDKVVKRIAQAADLMQKKYNKRIKEVTFQEGDKVKIYPPDGEKPKKLSAVCEGPGTVTKKLTDLSYIVDDKRINVNRLEKYISRPQKKQAHTEENKEEKQARMDETLEGSQSSSPNFVITEVIGVRLSSSRAARVEYDQRQWPMLWSWHTPVTPPGESPLDEDTFMSLENEEEAQATNSSGADLEEWIHNNTLNMDDFNETIYEGNKESLTQVTNTSDLIHTRGGRNTTMHGIDTSRDKQCSRMHSYTHRRAMRKAGRENQGSRPRVT